MPFEEDFLVGLMMCRSLCYEILFFEWQERDQIFGIYKE